jgi:cell division protein ZipA
MMHNFQPILIAIGILAIVGVLIHGFLLSKKDEESLLPDEYDDSLEELEYVDDEPYVTTVKRDVDAMEAYGTSMEEEDEIDSFDFTESELEPDANEDDLSEFASELTPKSLEKNKKIPLKQDKTDVDKEDLVPATKKIEPVDIFIFNVVARDGSRLGGHELLQFFLTSGFRYGHMNIFHRHENSDGTGEVLFSIANMMSPGTFDLDSMEQFQSKGISFFLTAPNDKIDVKKAFDLMLRAVVQIADEFECDVLNEQREVLTEAQFIEYRSRLLRYT